MISRAPEGVEAPKATSRRTAVLILNWNRADDTIECLESLTKMEGDGHFPVVVDNGSTDDSMARIVERFPDLHVLENGENLGFAEGNNRGIEHSLALGADYVLILNNDVIVDPGLMRELLAAADAHPEAGVFGARVFDYKEPQKIQYGGAEWRSKTGHFYITDLNQTEADSKIHGVTSIPWACGCAFLARAEVFRKVGLMDPRYYLLWEEIDWCSRARAGGFDVVLVPDAKVWHKGSQSFDGGTFGALRSYYHWRNRMLWVEREFSFGQRCKFYGRAMLPQIHRRLRAAISPRSKPEHRKVARAEILGLWHYLVRRFGPAPDSVKA
ncbi:MAG: glycosyltransferase family 2 protein [Planctomycetota bacterium]